MLESVKKVGLGDRRSNPGIPTKWNTLGAEPHCRMGIIILTGRVTVRTEISIFKSAGHGTVAQ